MAMSDSDELHYQMLAVRADEREKAREALSEGREDLARLLARLSAEQASNDGERLWEAIPFDDWWEGIGLTMRGREMYRKDADRVIEFMQGLI
jgi:hypothetical protein